MAMSWKAEVGINHTPAYQVSGRPYATGSIDASEATKITFPYVTRWIYVINHTSSHCRVGFSQNGVEGTNYFRLSGETGNEANQGSQRLELKVSEIWLSGSNSVDIVAGLTTIPSGRTSGSLGPNFSGSVGVG